jgi:hypothetical protein
MCVLSLLAGSAWICHDTPVFYAIAWCILFSLQAGFLFWIELVYVPRLLRYEFCNRSDISDGLFYSRYAASGAPIEEIAELRRELGSVFGVPVEKIRSEDDFCYPGFLELGERTCAGFERAAQATERRTGVCFDVDSVATVDDYIRAWTEAARWRKSVGSPRAWGEALTRPRTSERQ